MITDAPTDRPATCQLQSALDPHELDRLTSPAFDLQPSDAAYAAADRQITADGDGHEGRDGHEQEAAGYRDEWRGSDEYRKTFVKK